MNRTSWIVTAAAAATALIIGFGAGWFGNQAYLRASLEAAFEDVGTDLEEGFADEVEEPGLDEPADPVEATPDIPEGVPMGETASDGIWDVSIVGVERTSQINGSYSNAVTAEGWEFLVLDVELTNSSNGPQTPEIDGSQIVDAEGNRYGVNSDGIFALDDDDVLYTEVNPNGTATVRIPFELVAGTEVVVALLTAAWDAPETAVIRVEE
ncbi:DUF4352 domain-containing protein [Nocardiopsis sp. EMB25]|uniref:hypothetical protein n=1 Tax=Nocardiopsis sp. EMB25 TaxID=2835867 RepID=UPI0022836546|nr:hypothetical protein [Nocardiopsis sp. EMB25]MCY9784319.1 DUF4352 domain-containing protein [Nocardiopsis sp. EMB25]